MDYDDREAQKAAQAAIIARRGYCEGCGSKVKKRLAHRHAYSCSVSYLNWEEILDVSSK